jgi:coatomer subunit beta
LHEDFGKRLNKVMALTAFGDPLYCEAIVTMHSFDIILDIFIVNRTAGVPSLSFILHLYFW